jgi:hypothetical protein
MRPHRRTIACALLTLLGACGGGGAVPHSFEPQTGLADEKPLPTLTKEEAKRLCEQARAYVDETVPPERLRTVSCSVAGSFAASLAGANTDAQLRMSCKRVYDDCMRRTTVSTAAFPTVTISCQPGRADCMATVGEVEACLKDARAALDEFLSALPTCDKLTVMPASDKGTTIELKVPASCNELDLKCPGQVRVPRISVGG